MPYNWYLKEGYFCDSGPHLDRPCSLFLLLVVLVVQEPRVFNASQVLCSGLFVTLFLPQRQGHELGLPRFTFLAPDVPWCLFGQWHVKANKIRSGWCCDKVSAPMALPGLWQAPGQVSPWPLGGDWQRASVILTASPKAEGNVKGSCEKPPRPPATVTPGDTVSGETSPGWGSKGGLPFRVRPELRPGQAVDICRCEGLQFLEVPSYHHQNHLKGIRNSN